MVILLTLVRSILHSTVLVVHTFALFEPEEQARSTSACRTHLKWKQRGHSEISSPKGPRLPTFSVSSLDGLEAIAELAPALQPGFFPRARCRLHRRPPRRLFPVRIGSLPVH